MAETVVADVTLTWTAAAGCVLYLWMLFRAGRRGGGPQQFLIAVLACLLFVRGFDWLYSSGALGRLTLAFAAMLPLATTLFVERVLRRHHPLWFKLVSLAATLILFAVSVFTPLSNATWFLVTFAGCSASVVFINGISVLIRKRASLSQGENALADVLILLAPIAVALVLSDFGLFAEVTPLRLGSIAALLLVYSMLGTALDNVHVHIRAWRYLLLLGPALILAVVITQSAPGSVNTFAWPRFQTAWAVAYAWILLTVIVFKGRELSAEGTSAGFMHWLTRAPMGSAVEFAESMGVEAGLPTHLLLRAPDLREYSFPALERLCNPDEPVVSIARARQVQRASGELLSDSSEQWIDLLERTEMTHGFIVAREPAQVLLLNVPASALPDRAEKQLRVMSHICWELDQRNLPVQESS